MGILNKHTDHKLKCPTCGEVYDLRFLDQVAKHLHAGIVIDETIKGTREGPDIHCEKRPYKIM